MPDARKRPGASLSWRYRDVCLVDHLDNDSKSFKRIQFPPGGSGTRPGFPGATCRSLLFYSSRSSARRDVVFSSSAQRGSGGFPVLPPCEIMAAARSRCKQWFSVVAVQKKRSTDRFRKTFAIAQAHCVSHRSSTSRSPLARDTQIIMVLLAARSSGESKASRCSGSPASTTVSQVPQTPSSHTL